jgi:hypothetical protein
VKRFVLCSFAVALATHAMLGGSNVANAAIITAIETNVDGAGWVPLGSSAGPSVGPISGNLGGAFTLTNMSAISFNPSELLSTNLLLTNTTAATHTVQIVVASTDFANPVTPPALLLTSTIGGTAINSAAGSSVFFQSFVDQGNHSDHTGEVGAFTTGLQLTNLPTGSVTNAFIGPLAAPYSLIQEYDIMLVGNDHVQFSGDTVLTTPEPASIVLVGFGAAGMLGYRWKRRLMG